MSTAFAPQAVGSPEQTTVVTIQGVAQRTVNRRDGSGSFTIYDVDTSLGTMNATKREVAESAFSLLNQQAQVRFTVKQNGNYTNTYLNEVLPVLPNPVEAARKAQEAAGRLAQAHATPDAYVTAREAPIVPQGGIRDKDAETRESIHRQTASKVSAQISNSPDEFWRNVDALVHYYETGESPHPDIPATDDIPY